MKYLLTADLHVTDNPRDEYRWGLFPWLAKQAKKYKVDSIVILGDLTDAKNNHSEALVNRVVDNLELLGKAAPTIFSPGNHDGIQEGRPFFKFSNHIHNVTCLTEALDDHNGSLFLPHSRDPERAWKGIDFSAYEQIFVHQTFDGCKGENGFKLSGLSPSIFGDYNGAVWSGDIHVPQRVSKHPHIEYIGAPYRVRFGDQFDPRVVLLADGVPSDLHFPCLRKFLVEVSGADPVAAFQKQIKQQDIREGDQVKLRVMLSRSSYAEWPDLRSALSALAKEAGIALTGPELIAAPADKAQKSPERGRAAPSAASPDQMLRSYAKKKSLSAGFLEAGAAFLKD